MNLPVSEIVEQGKVTGEFKYKEITESSMEKEFSGYFIVTTDGFDGIEEGVLIFRRGYLVACLYEILNYGITVFGDTALRHALNSFLNPKGIVDIYGLTNQQVDLVAAFNDKIKLKRPVTKREVQRLYPGKFSAEMSKGLLKEVVSKRETKESLLKRLGLGNLG
jgi:hypothetical protein